MVIIKSIVSAIEGINEKSQENKRQIKKFYTS